MPAFLSARVDLEGASALRMRYGNPAAASSASGPVCIDARRRRPPTKAWRRAQHKGGRSGKNFRSYQRTKSRGRGSAETKWSAWRDAEPVFSTAGPAAKPVFQGPTREPKGT